MIPFIGTEVEERLDWVSMIDALEAGHRLPRARIADAFVTEGDETLLSRAARINGLGSAVKSVTVMPSNAAKGLPSVHGAMLLFSEETGEVEAVIDSALVTKWKTAADSVLGARLLANPNPKNLLIAGAGAVARSLVNAYRAQFPGISVTIWNRTRANAEKLAADMSASVAEDLGDAVSKADIISTATLSPEPLLKGDWLRPGQHLDLIGAFTATMREADDSALLRSQIFVDSRETTLDHIGELKIPLMAGVISETDVLGDLYDLVAGSAGRKSEDIITLFKNGGGAHLDLMTGRAILKACTES
jgi:ornithine cyclodeaminase/alanine dehydrogenase-like protein (mu-crystallin family)